MTIEYSVTFQNGGVTIRQTVVGASVSGGGQQDLPDGGGQQDLPDGGNGGLGASTDQVLAVVLGPLVIGGSQYQPNANGNQVTQLNPASKAAKGHQVTQLNPVPKAGALLTVEKQRRSNWCWAAVAVSVAEYYQKNQPPDVNPPETECSLAARFLLPQSPSNACCRKPFPEKKCDRPHSLDDVLEYFGVKVLKHPGQLSFQRTKELIRRRVPVPVHINWGGGRGHFVVLTKTLVTRDGAEAVYVSDPFFTSHWVLFDEFKQAYHATSSNPNVASSAGFWDWTFIL